MHAKEIILCRWLLLSFLIGSTGCVQQTYSLAIENVKLFDSKSKQIFPNKTILIQGDEIAEIIDSKEGYQASKIIRGKGRLICPGFVDTHVHLHQIYDWPNDSSPETLEGDSLKHYHDLLAQQYLPYGTTTIADMGQPEEWMTTTLDWQKHPSPHYPNLYNVGGAIISDLSWNRNPAHHHTVVKDSGEAKKKVQTYAETG